MAFGCVFLRLISREGLSPLYNTMAVCNYSSPLPLNPMHVPTVEFIRLYMLLTTTTTYPLYFGIRGFCEGHF